MESQGRVSQKLHHGHNIQGDERKSLYVHHLSTNVDQIKSAVQTSNWRAFARTMAGLLRLLLYRRYTHYWDWEAYLLIRPSLTVIYKTLGDDMRTYIQKLSIAADKLREREQPLPEIQLVSKALTSLPEGGELPGRTSHTLLEKSRDILKTQAKNTGKLLSGSWLTYARLWTLASYLVELAVI